MRALQCTQRCGVALRGGVLAPLPHAAARHHQPRQPAPCAATRLPRSAAGPAGGTRAAAHAAAAAAVAAPAPLPLDAASAHTLELQVYIEFTDCFQVVYYANYQRFAAAGREAALGAPLLAELRGRGLRPVVLAITGGRLASPAVLGDLLAVRSHVVASDGTRLTFRHSVGPAGAPGAKPHASCDVTVAFADAAGALHPLPPHLAAAAPPPAAPLPPLAPYPDNAPVAVTRIVPFADELGPGGAPSDTDLLRWFERNRTDAIGGAAGLRALQSAGVLVVVTGIGPLRVDPAAAAAAASATDGALTVRSGVLLKRRGTFIVFRQEVYGAGGALLAQGEVTCACVASADMKLTAAPPDLAARLAAAGAAAA